MMKSKTLKMARKLIIWNVFIIILPIVVLTNSLLIKYQNDFRNQAKEHLNSSFKEVVFSIDENISMMQGLLFSVANNGELVNKIGKESDYTDEDILLMDQVYSKDLESLIYSYPKINALRIFNDHEELYEFWPVIYNLKRIQNETLKTEMIENNKLWKILDKASYFDINATKDEVGKTISFFSNVKRPLSDYNVIVEVSMDLDTFFRDLENSSEVNKEFYCILQDGKEIQRSSNLVQILEDDTEGFEAFLLNHLSVASEQTAELDYQKGDIIGNLYHIKQTDTYIYRGVSLKAYSDVISEERNRIILLMVAFTFFLILMIRSITGVLFNRLQKLILSVKGINKSNLTTFEVVDGHDEITDLSMQIKNMLVEIDGLNQLSLYEQRLTMDAEIKALLSQINEHFIYNMLETFKMMAEIDESYELSDLITKFGELLRYSMDWKNKKTVPLMEELESIKKYVHLINHRYDYEVRLSLQIEAELEQTEILKMSLQPIIENAFIHGIEPKSEDSSISILAYFEDVTKKNILIEIVDDGVGMNQEILEHVNRLLLNCEVTQSTDTIMGIGIKNINDRIKMYFGMDYGMYFESLEGLYTKVIIKLPKVGEGYASTGC